MSVISYHQGSHGHILREIYTKIRCIAERNMCQYAPIWTGIITEYQTEYYSKIILTNLNSDWSTFWPGPVKSLSCTEIEFAYNV